MGLRRETGRWLRRALLGMLLLLVLLVGGRAVQAWLAPDLPPWLTVVPQEPDIAALDAGDWAGAVAAEQYAFQAARREVASRLTPAQRTPANRFFDDSPLDPARFATDWNRSFLLTPDGPPAGAAVLLHGMTDSPFSMRHLAETYRARGWVAIVPRMPGHGILPAGLSDAGWDDWLASTRMAVREARARAGNGPIHLVGYSNGGALALKYALDAIEEPRLPRPDRLVLVSPMIGVTAFARFAGFAGLPALLPAFERAAWLDVVPEFNPFKFNSFPVNAARQSHLLTAAVQEQTRRLSAAGRLDRLAPVLTFQSVVDSTVSAAAVVTALYAHLPENGSELVLFDLNRNAKLGPLVAPRVELALERLVPPAPRRYRVTLVTNADADSAAAVARSMPAGATTVEQTALGVDWPREMFSLSHVALPFPLTDGLYGLTPDPADRFGVTLGALAPRGETGLLVVGLESLMRVSSNPFFSWMRARIEATIPAR
jgi:alpha-beta hydrolase superfamily lysophospholipase